MPGVVRSLITRILFKSDETGLKKVETHTRAAKREMRAANRAAFTLKRQLRGLAVGWRSLLATAAGAQLAKIFTVNFAKAADEAAKFSKAIGISIQAYQGLTHAAELNGATQENVNKALPQLAKRSAEAADGQKKQMIAFARLGVSVKDATGRLKSADRLFLEVADGMLNLRDEGRRTQIAMDLFGRTGATLMPTFLRGSKGIRAAMLEAKQLGIVLSKEQAKIAENFNDEMLRARSVLKAVRNQIAVRLLPAITKNIRAFQLWMREGDNLERMVKRLITVLKILKVAMTAIVAVKFGQTLLTIVSATKKAVFWTKLQARATLAAYGPYIALAAAIGAIVLIIQSLIVWSRGGKSAVGDLFKHFGIADKARKVVNALGKAWQAIMKALPVIARALLRVASAVKEVLAALWEEFGADLTELGRAIVRLFMEIYPVVVAIAKTAHEEMVALIKILGKTWREDVKPAIQDVMAALSDLWVAAAPIVRQMISGILEFWGIVTDLAKKAIPKFGEQVAFTFKAIALIIKAGIAQVTLFVNVVTKIVRGLKTAINFMLTLLGLKGDTDLGATLARRGIRPAGAPARAAGPTTNTLSVGTVSTTVTGTANMTPEEVEAAVKRGTNAAFQEQLNNAFASVRALVPG